MVKSRQLFSTGPKWADFAACPFEGPAYINWDCLTMPYLGHFDENSENLGTCSSIQKITRLADRLTGEILTTPLYPCY